MITSGGIDGELLAGALGEVVTGLRRIESARDRLHVNGHGGDPGHHGSPTLLIRHTANYLMAAAAGAEASDGCLVDVGAGTGAFSWWLGRRLGRDTHIVDTHEGVRRVARLAFPDVSVHASLEEAPPAAVVTAMEVLEHLPYPEQPDFLGRLAAMVRPGGVLVISTPDESRYVGGRSFYPPHVGPVTFTQLEALVGGLGGDHAVYRISGPTFRMSRAKAVFEPLGCRLWSRVSTSAPGFAHRSEQLVAAFGRSVAPHVPDVPDEQIRVSHDRDGRGTGLLAVVRPG